MKKVESILRKEDEDRISKWITPKFHFVRLPYTTIISRYIGNARTRLIAKFREKILQTMKKMKWKEFEVLCRYLLEINGISIADVSKTSKGGDFFGLAEMDKFVKESILFKGARFRIFGEAKRRKEKIERGEIREFCKRYREVASGEETIKYAPEWFRKSKFPILGFFITTSTFRKNTREYAEKEGVILKDGEQIIEDLLRLPEAKDMWFSSKNGELIFDEKKFIEFFQKLKDSIVEKSSYFKN